MRNIIISDGINTITLKNDIKFDIQPSIISSTATMASGRDVSDVVGYKNKLTIPSGYLDLENMSKLKNMISKNGGLLQISYPSPTGDKTEWFIVDPPKYTTFTYNNDGVAIWKGVTITATAVEVEQ